MHAEKGDTYSAPYDMGVAVAQRASWHSARHCWAQRVLQRAAVAGRVIIGRAAQESKNTRPLRSAPRAPRRTGWRRENRARTRGTRVSLPAHAKPRATP